MIHNSGRLGIFPSRISDVWQRRACAMNEDWATEEMTGATLHDQRRVTSVIRICAALAANPDLSFSAACGPAVRQAAHRIFAHEDTSAESLLEGHFAATATRSEELPLILIAQDTTAFVYGQQQIVGLAPVNQLSKSRALFGHSALAMTPGGTPLGLWHLAFWGAEEGPQVPKVKARAREDKKSWKWFEALESVAARLPAGSEGLLIQDREADIFDFLAQERPERLHLLVRAAQDRRIEYEPVEEAPSACPAATDDRTERGRLFAVAASAPVLGHYCVSVPRKPAQGGQPAQPARAAELAVRVTEARLQRPRRHSTAAQAELSVWIICATEVQPPPGVEPLQWVLLYTLPIADLEAACRVLGYYSRRWLVERLHYTLKSGLGAQKLQIDDAVSLAHALALYYVVAWRLLYLTYTARENPDAPATTVLDADEVAVLEAATGQPVPTVAAAVTAIARLGGYQPYRNGPPPGVKVLWQGQIRLDSMRIGWQLAKGVQARSQDL